MAVGSVAALLCRDDKNCDAKGSPVELADDDRLDDDEDEPLLLLPVSESESDEEDEDESDVLDDEDEESSLSRDELRREGTLGCFCCTGVDLLPTGDITFNFPEVVDDVEPCDLSREVLSPLGERRLATGFLAIRLLEALAVELPRRRMPSWGTAATGGLCSPASPSPAAPSKSTTLPLPLPFL